MRNAKKAMSLVLAVSLALTVLFAASSASAATIPSTTWYLYNTSISGVTPAGQILEPTKEAATGWQPTRAITTTAAYWYTDTHTGTYPAGNWQFVLWTNSPGSSSIIRVEVYKTNANGSNAELIGGQQLDVSATGGGNHPSAFGLTGTAAASLSGQRLMVKIFKVSGADATMAYNTNDFPTRLLTPTGDDGPTTPPVSDEFWGDPSTIPAAANVMMFKFINRTNGVYADNQVYWSFRSGSINEVHTIAEQSTYDMPANSAGRMYFGVGAPPNAANPNSYWDFIEFTIGPTAFNGNTTRVDAFGLKLATRLHCSDGYDVAVGENEATFNESRAATFQRFKDAVPAEFQACATRYGNYRIVEPGAAGFNAGGSYANYYNSYVDQIWQNNGITIPKPGPNGSGLGAHPDLSAAIYRHVGAAAGSFNADGSLRNTSLWSNPATFYTAAPANYYAKFWHDCAIDGKSYGFPYDDVGGYSSFIAHGNPQYMIVAIGF